MGHCGGNSISVFRGISTGAGEIFVSGGGGGDWALGNDSIKF